MSDDTELEEGLKRGLEQVDAPRPPGLDRVARRARSLRARKYLAGAAVAAVVAAGMTVPLLTLSGIGGSERPRTVTPGGPGGTTPQPEALPDVAGIVCDGETTTVLTPEVRPRTDGVHLSVDNRAGTELALSVQYEGGAGAGTSAPPGVTEPSSPSGGDGWPAPPGTMYVACSADGDVSLPEDGVAIEIVDEGGLWVPSTIACPSAVSAIRDFVPDAEGEVGEPQDVVAAHLEGLQDTDVVERAGYPAGFPVVVRVSRGGETVATAELVPDHDGDGWLISVTTVCEDSGITG